MLRERAFSLLLSDGALLAAYGPRVRAAHELADSLKLTHPHLFEQVTEIQAKVVACQQTLDQAKTQLQQAPTPTDYFARKQQPAPTLDRATLLALEELESATQSLLDLRHEGQTSR